MSTDQKITITILENVEQKLLASLPGGYYNKDVLRGIKIQLLEVKIALRWARNEKEK